MPAPREPDLAQAKTMMASQERLAAVTCDANIHRLRRKVAIILHTISGSARSEAHRRLKVWPQRSPVTTPAMPQASRGRCESSPGRTFLSTSCSPCTERSSPSRSRPTSPLSRKQPRHTCGHCRRSFTIANCSRWRSIGCCACRSPDGCSDVARAGNIRHTGSRSCCEPWTPSDGGCAGAAPSRQCLGTWRLNGIRLAALLVVLPILGGWAGVHGVAQGVLLANAGAALLALRFSTRVMSQ